MFANLVMFAILALVCSIVSSEVYAALKAVEYAWGLDKVSSTWVRLRIAVARYEWSSVIFHESYYARIDRTPAYRASIPLAIWAGMMAMYIGGFYGFSIEVAPWQMIGSSMATATGFFFTAYGRAFFASRDNVARQVDQGTWSFA